jgi:hypothetical protein
LKSERTKHASVTDSLMKLLIHSISYLKNVEYDFGPIIPPADDVDLNSEGQAYEYDDYLLKKLTDGLGASPVRAEWIVDEREKLERLTGWKNIFSGRAAEHDTPPPKEGQVGTTEEIFHDRIFKVYQNTVNSLGSRNPQLAEQMRQNMDAGNTLERSKDLICSISRLVSGKNPTDPTEKESFEGQDLDNTINCMDLLENRILISIYFELFSQDQRANYLVNEEVFTNFIALNRKYLNCCLAEKDWPNAIRYKNFLSKK